MQRFPRHTMALLLLGSYLFASVGTWLHNDREALCRGHCESPGMHPAVGTAAACGEHACASSPACESSGQPPSRRHHSDQCVICRFLVIKKSVDGVPAPSVSASTYPQFISLAVPACYVARLWATPECRAPPLAT